MAPLIEGASPVGLLRGQLLEGLETETARSRQYHHLARDAPRGHRLPAPRRRGGGRPAHRAPWPGCSVPSTTWANVCSVTAKRRTGGACHPHAVLGVIRCVAECGSCCLAPRRRTRSGSRRRAGTEPHVRRSRRGRRSQDHNIVETVFRRYAARSRSHRSVPHAVLADLQQVGRGQPQWAATRSPSAANRSALTGR